MWAQASELCETLGEDPSHVDPAEARNAGFIWTLLPRHGRRPARFLGREMLRADNRAAARAGLARHWSDIQIYELYQGGFVTSVRHLRTEDDRASYQDVWPVRDARGVIASLRMHDVDAALPCEVTIAAPEPAAKAWQSLVGAIFGMDGPA